MKLKRVLKVVTTNWKGIERLGNSKLAKNSYYWFFLIPILAKIFHKIPDKIYIENFITQPREPIEINLSFPFTWYLIFIVGILFILSNIIYRVACPHIVREFSNYSEFINSGYPNSYLIYQGNFHNIPETETREFERNLPSHDGFKTKMEVTDYEKEHNFRNSQKEYFDLIYNTANESKLIIRLFATLIIIIAFLLISWIVMQNIMAVYEIYHLR